MNIVQEYNETYSTQRIEVQKATYLGNFVIKFSFADGFESKVDFKPFLSSAQHPDIKKYLHEDEFKNFALINGNLIWNDFEMIFPLSDLYAGKIS
jgi:hypothetical protein